MRLFVMAAILCPSLAWASDWVELGKTREARILLDQASVEAFDGNARATLKFVYRRTQSAQTISRGSPFDSSINQYYLACSEKKYQVLDLTVFYRNKAVGAFHQALNLDDLDAAKPNTGVMFLLDRVCARGVTPRNSPSTARDR